MNAVEAYRRLEERSWRVALLGSVAGVLGWDQQVNLPARGGEFRAKQLAEISRIEHLAWVDKEVGEWLERACGEGVEELAAGVGKSVSVVAGNLREWQRRWKRKVVLPERLVEELAEAGARGFEAWVEARKEASFALFLPSLQRILELVQEKADRWVEAGLARGRYDALLDEYEVGLGEEEALALLEPMVAELRELVVVGEEVCEKGKGGVPSGPYPVSAQVALNREVAAAVGFDFGRGRLDCSPHPFCSSLGPEDVRLTTRYDEGDFTSSLFGVLHEVGHGLYELGLDKEEYGTPAGEAISLGVHESQSRLWENCVGRSLEFWERWLPVARQYFPQLKKATPEGVWRHVNRVERGFVRVEADEVTYDLHVILRFRIERLLIKGELSAEDLPAAWNDAFLELFGKKVPNDAVGCLQDVHWSGGGFGYFPTYTLGNVYAANLFAAARRDISGLEEKLRLGDYGCLLEWLRQKVHRWGSTKVPRELIELACGASIDLGVHVGRLREKVLKLDKIV
ncbi:MAG: carboxypeptidase M32 [Chthoniobacterales bacterium]|nr:carboxypeptidase M32 [Chthoniobacterales bacterium]MCX7713073.1 carboxypeptidase M32 [Chthoniobacterales bacterium]